MIFNIVVDAIVWEHAYHFPSISVLYYADDGRIADVNDPFFRRVLISLQTYSNGLACR